MSTEEAGALQKTLTFAKMQQLPDYFKEKAERELNESPEKRITGLEELKVMAREHKLTCDINFVDDFLLQFLRQRKYNVNRAFKQLVNFISFRKNYSSWFLSIDNDIFFSHPCRQFCTILPLRCPDGCTIILFELGKWDPEEVSFQEFKQMVVMMYTQSLRDPMTQINGFKIIHDFKDTSLKHMKYCTPANLYRVYQGALDCFPCRFKEIHFVSDSPIMKTVWTMVKAIVSRKLQQRIFVNSSREDLLKYFPPSVLPVQYGGRLEDYYTMEWTKECNKQQKEFTLQGQCNYY